MNKNQLTLADLEAHFVYRNKAALPVGILNSSIYDIWIRRTIWDKAPVVFNLVIIIKDPAPNLTKKLDISSINHLDGLTFEYLWEQYQKGNAEVVANMYSFFNSQISFRQQHGKTYVINHREHEQLIDVLEETSQDVNWFRGYIRDNASRWYKMAEEMAMQQVESV